MGPAGPEPWGKAMPVALVLEAPLTHNGPAVAVAALARLVKTLRLMTLAMVVLACQTPSREPRCSTPGAVVAALEMALLVWEALAVAATADEGRLRWLPKTERRTPAVAAVASAPAQTPGLAVPGL
jgi:hypothetical protein